MIRVRAVLLICSLAALGYLGASGWTDIRRASRLEISPEFDVGELVHDQQLDLKIGFRNVGDGVLKMERPIPGCKCSLGELSRSEFGPGEQGYFRIKLRAAQSPGSHYAQEIIVPSNDPFEPRRIVIVRGRMQSSLVSSPEALHVPRLSPGEHWKRSLTLACTDRDATFEVTSVACDLTGCEITEPIRVPNTLFSDGPAFQIEIWQMPRSVGKSFGHIVVQTNHSRYHTLRIPVDVEVKSYLTANPGSLLFDLSRPLSSQKIVVTSANAQQFSIADVGMDDAVYNIELTKDSTSTAWTVTVNLIPRLKLQSVWKSEIRLDISGLEGETELRIPISIVPSVVPNAGQSTPSGIPKE